MLRESTKQNDDRFSHPVVSVSLSKLGLKQGCESLELLFPFDVDDGNASLGVGTVR
jgi:hypothetical protein